MVQMAFCDSSHTFHKQLTNVSHHVFVILLWGILKSPLIIDLRSIVKGAVDGPGQPVVSARSPLYPEFEGIRFPPTLHRLVT